MREALGASARPLVIFFYKHTSEGRGFLRRSDDEE